MSGPGPGPEPVAIVRVRHPSSGLVETFGWPASTRSDDAAFMAAVAFHLDPWPAYRLELRGPGDQGALARLPPEMCVGAACAAYAGGFECFDLARADGAPAG